MISALSDADVIEAFGKVLLPMLQKMIDDAVGGLRARVNKLHSELQDRDVRLSELQKEK